MIRFLGFEWIDEASLVNRHGDFLLCIPGHSATERRIGLIDHLIIRDKKSKRPASARGPSSQSLTGALDCCKSAMTQVGQSISGLMKSRYFRVRSLHGNLVRKRSGNGDAIAIWSETYINGRDAFSFFPLLLRTATILGTKDTPVRVPQDQSG